MTETVVRTFTQEFENIRNYRASLATRIIELTPAKKWGQKMGSNRVFHKKWGRTEFSRVLSGALLFWPATASVTDGAAQYFFDLILEAIITQNEAGVGRIADPRQDFIAQAVAKKSSIGLPSFSGVIVQGRKDWVGCYE
jgi:hypothetical protein